MRTVFKDWDCRLLPMTGEWITRPDDTVRSMVLLKEKFGIKRFHMSPRFDPEYESVAAFLLRRDKAMDELRTLIPEGFTVSCGAVSVLTVGLSEQLGLKRLCIPKTNFLPVMLPILDNHQALFTELNRLLYHTPYRVMFYAFDTLLPYYSKEDIARWIELPDAAYCFRYQSLENAEARRTMKRLLARRAPIVFGTGINSYGKACYYEFDHYMSIAAEYFPEHERDRLFHSSQLYKI